MDEQDIRFPRPALVPRAVAAARDRVNEDRAGREPPQADTATVLEHAGIRMTLAAGFLKGGIEVATAGPGQSSAAAAVTMLILTGAAVLSSTAVGFVLWLAHAPSLLLGGADIVTFASTLAVGVILVFRRDGKTASAVDV